jgi:glycosyltransferase involved in cell wall biosynthesis
VDLTLSVIVPAYNEERRLPATLDAILRYLGRQSYASEVIVSDDGSDDRTREIAMAYVTAPPDPAGNVAVRVLSNPHRGKAATVRSGVLQAGGQYVLFMDADLATPIEEWPKLYALLRDGADVAIGSREGLGAERIGEPWYRHLMGRVFNAVVRAIALSGIQDTQCGFKAFTSEAARRIFSGVRLYGDGARPVSGPAVTAFDVEVLFLARKWGYRIGEVPVVWRYGEETKVDPFRDSLRNFPDVLRVRWNDLRGRYAAGPPASVQDGPPAL